MKGAREKRMEGFAEIERLNRVEERRRSQVSAEIEEINNAMQESRDMQAQVEANLRQEKKDKAGREKEIAAKAAEAAEAAKASQIAGKKRKSDASEESIETRLDLAGRPYIPRHKRSKTEVQVNSDQDSEEIYERHRVRYTHTRQQPVGRSLFSRTLSNYGTRRSSESLLRRSIDTTKTDYFKLKALGINPETPVVPLTAAQVERQREQAEAERARRAAEPKPWEGNSTLRRLSSDLTLSDFSMPPPAKPLTKPLLASQKSRATTSAVNDLLDKLKEFNQAQATETDWYKARRQELEQLEDPAEDLVQVHQTIERRDSFQTDSSSLMRSSLGYEFVPAEPKPGQTLSRTEQRIRHTGARGLATAPIGGTPGYVKPKVGYLERTLTSNVNGTTDHLQDGATPNGSHSGVDLVGYELQPAHRSKKASNGKGKERAVEEETDNDSNCSNGHAHPQLGLSTTEPRSSVDLNETEELYQQRLASEDVLQDDGQFSEGDYYAGNYDEEDEEDLDEYDEEEDEVDDEEHAGPSHRGQHLSATPDAVGRASRGASSGAGTSAEPIDLDSD